MGEDYDGFSFKTDSVKPDDTTSPLPHYYGDAIRKLFLIAGILMLITLPFLHERVSVPIFFSIIVILALAFAAGITSPKRGWVIFVDMVISLGGLFVFAFDAVLKFKSMIDLLFATNISLALIFLFAFYLSVKTFRGSDSFIKKTKKEGVVENLKAVAGLVEVETPADKPKVTQSPTEEERRKKRFLSNDTQ